MFKITRTDEERATIFRKCRFFLSGNPRRPISETLIDLAQGLDPEIPADNYGMGHLIEAFEEKIARFLVFPAAVFMPSGTMAQSIALRIWCDRKGSKNVAFHPQSHLEVNEHKAYSAVHGLTAILVGDPKRLLTLEELKTCPLPLSAFLLELPQRHIGGLLPSWDELLAMREWTRSQGIAFHLDGARLWECQSFYGRTCADIAALFDSVYVSFYKGLGGITGAMLLGDPQFINESKIWQRRQGGNLKSLFPYIVSAEKSFDLRVGKMNRYREKATEIAEVLSTFTGVKLSCNPPHTNMMHAYFNVPMDRLNAASLEIARDHHFGLFQMFFPTDDPAIQMTEITIGDCALELSKTRIETILRIFFEKIGVDP